MRHLLQGVLEFQDRVFPGYRDHFVKLAMGQQPSTLFITCSDSRIVPNLITQTKPGELFILRNAGNIVPPYGAGVSGEEATIEYAVNALKVSDIVVCGHSRCGAMGGLLQPDMLKDIPSMAKWLQYAEDTKKIIDENYTHLTDLSDRLAAASEENVLVQVQHLYGYPCVEQAIQGRGLSVHAWIYELESGQVSHYEAEALDFVPLAADQVQPVLQAD